jgi:hypothetical protein
MADAQKIVAAADGNRGKYRRRLLAACGLIDSAEGSAHTSV